MICTIAIGAFRAARAANVSFMPGDTFFHVEDRQNARYFKPLRVVVPKGVHWAMPVVPPIKEPIVAQAKDIQIIILPENKLKAYYHRKKEHDFYQITVDSFKVLSWDEESKIIEKDFASIEKESNAVRDDK